MVFSQNSQNICLCQRVLLYYCNVLGNTSEQIRYGTLHGSFLGFIL